MFTKNEIVRVAYQPVQQRQVVGDFVGKVGFIEDVTEDHSRALLQCLSKDGKLAGAAWMPVKCLVRECSQEWHTAYGKYQEWLKRLTSDAETRHNSLSELASRYSLKPLSVRDLLEISQQVGSLAF